MYSSGELSLHDALKLFFDNLLHDEKVIDVFNLIEVDIFKIRQTHTCRFHIAVS